MFDDSLEGKLLQESRNIAADVMRLIYGRIDRESPDITATQWIAVMGYIEYFFACLKEYYTDASGGNIDTSVKVQELITLLCAFEGQPKERLKDFQKMFSGMSDRPS